MKVYVVVDNECHYTEAIYNEETFLKEYKTWGVQYWQHVDVYLWEVDTQNREFVCPSDIEKTC